MHVASRSGLRGNDTPIVRQALLGISPSEPIPVGFTHIGLAFKSILF